MLLGERAGRGEKLERGELEALALEAADDLSDEPALDSVGLDLMGILKILKFCFEFFWQSGGGGGGGGGGVESERKRKRERGVGGLEGRGRRRGVARVATVLNMKISLSNVPPAFSFSRSLLAPIPVIFSP